MVKWTGKLYAMIARIYIDGANNNVHITGTQMASQLSRQLADVVSTGSAVWHFSKLKSLSNELYQRGDVSEEEWKAMMARWLRTTEPNFTDAHKDIVREMGRIVSGRRPSGAVDSGQYRSAAVSRKKVIVDPTKRKFRVLDPNVITAITNVIETAMTPQIEETIEHEVNYVLTKNLTKRIIGKVVGRVVESVVSAIEPELRAAKKARIAKLREVGDKEALEDEGCESESESEGELEEGELEEGEVSGEEEEE